MLIRSQRFYLLALALQLACLSLFAQQTNCGVFEKQTRASRVFMTIDRNGVLGNGFSGVWIPGVCGEGRYASCQFPRASGIEHIQYGGLWYGGFSRRWRQNNVITGAYLSSRAYQAGARDFELYAPAGQIMTERSNSQGSGNLFDPNAVSTQDFLTTFADTAAAFVPGTRVPIDGDKRPLGIAIDFESYNWNLSATQNFIILEYRMRNIGRDTIDNFHVSMWADGVIRNINITQPTAGTAFFNRSGNNYVDSLDMSYEFDAPSNPEDAENANSYYAMKYLGGTFWDTLRDENGFILRDAQGNPLRTPDGKIARRKVYAHKRNPLYSNTTNPSLINRFKNHFYTFFFSQPSHPRYNRPNSDAERFIYMTRGLNVFGSDSAGENIPFSTLQRQIRVPGNRSNLISAGPFGSFLPGDTIVVNFGIICAPKVIDGENLSKDTEAQRALLLRTARNLQSIYQGRDTNYDGVPDLNIPGETGRFLLPSPPDAPKDTVIAANNKIEIYWTANAERSRDRLTGERDFEGYRILGTRLGFDVTGQVGDFNLDTLAQFDTKGNNIFFDNGFDAIKLPQPWIVNNDTFVYKYTMNAIPNGWQQIVAVTAFDRGDPATGLESEESSPEETIKRVFPGTIANTDLEANKPFVYPNPYYAGAAWESGAVTIAQNRKIVFANLPKRCKIRVLSSAGDLIDQFDHDETYSGSDISWFRTLADSKNIVFSGGERAWDVLSSYDQILTRGIYLFSVEDKDTGKVFQGKFAVIK